MMRAGSLGMTREKNTVFSGQAWKTDIHSQECASSFFASPWVCMPGIYPLCYVDTVSAVKLNILCMLREKIYKKYPKLWHLKAYLKGWNLLAVPTQNDLPPVCYPN